MQHIKVGAVRSKRSAGVKVGRTRQKSVATKIGTSRSTGSSGVSVAVNVHGSC